MLKTMTLTMAVGAMLALFAVDAKALPLAPTTPKVAESTVTLVRDDCGRGRHFSRSRGHCVSDDRVRRDDCGPGGHFSPSRGHCVPNARVRRDDCGPGGHFSPSRGHCVPNGQARRDDCGPGGHFSQSRGHCVPNGRAFRDDCGPGRRFSQSRGHCVRVERDGDAAAAAVGAFINAIGNSNNRHHQQHPGADGRDD